jgi:hypothetical protein
MTEKSQYDANDMDHMVKIDTFIADMQQISNRFGNTCVYIRRGGLSWGAVALNRRGDDKKHGVFDLQAQHDRDMTQRVEQVERLLVELNTLRTKQETIAKELLTNRKIYEG